MILSIPTFKNLYFLVYIYIFSSDFAISPHVLSLFLLSVKLKKWFFTRTFMLMDMIWNSCNTLKFVNIVLLWYTSLLLNLSFDIHPNPGPMLCSPNDFSDGYLSFCNWNLNTLSKDKFSPVTLLEAHNSIFKYDIISLCETSLNDNIHLDQNIFPGYKFVSANNPDGSPNGGVGIFFQRDIASSH